MYWYYVEYNKNGGDHPMYVHCTTQHLHAIVRSLLLVTRCFSIARYCHCLKVRVYFWALEGCRVLLFSLNYCRCWLQKFLRNVLVIIPNWCDYQLLHTYAKIRTTMPTTTACRGRWWSHCRAVAVAPTIAAER